MKYRFLLSQFISLRISNFDNDVLYNMTLKVIASPNLMIIWYMRKWTSSSWKNQNFNVCRPCLKKQIKHGWKAQNFYVDISILPYTLLIPFFVFRFEFSPPWLKKRRRYEFLCFFHFDCISSCHKPNQVKHRYPFKVLFLFSFFWWLMFIDINFVVTCGIRKKESW